MLSQNPKHQRSSHTQQRSDLAAGKTGGPPNRVGDRRHIRTENIRKKLATETSKRRARRAGQQRSRVGHNTGKSARGVRRICNQSEYLTQESRLTYLRRETGKHCRRPGLQTTLNSLSRFSKL